MTARTDQQVDEARRQLRNLLTRRDFLTAASAGALGLAGCNGDPATGVQPPPPPAGGIPEGFQRVSGSVLLPPGSQLKLADLSVDVLSQTVPLSASSAFTVGITTDGPALALLLDRNGDGVLMSMFDAGLTPRTISSHTTAVALLYYGTGAFLLPAAAMSQVLSLLDADPAVAGLAAVVATTVAADAHALANNAVPLGPAITQALQAIVGPSLQVPPSAGPRPAIHSAADVPTLMLLNSVAEQNGIVVSLDTAAITVLVSNAKRRPCKVYVYEVTTQTGSTISDVSPARLVQGPFDIDSTQNLGVFNGLKAIAHGLNGEAPWTPVNLPPIPLTLTPATADKTTFQAIVLSSSPKWVSGDTFEPPFFRDPHFVNEIATWRADTKSLWAITVCGDLILPILCMIGGFGAIRAARSTVIQEVTNSRFLGSAVFQEIINTLQSGSMGTLEKGLAEVVQNSVRSGVGGNLESQWLPSVKAVVGDVRAKAIAIQSAPTIGSRMASGAKMFSSVFEPFFLAGFVLDGIDFGKVVHDFGESEIGALWEVALYRQKLGLVPQNPRVAGGERVSFRVSQPANLPPGSYQYDWTQTSPFGTLSAVGEANVGPSITTTQLSVDLITTGSDVLPIDLVVIGYDIGKTPRQEIGRAGTTVTFLQRAEILPANAAVEVGEQRLFSVSVDGQLPSGANYRWTLTGSGGTIGGNVVTTTLPQITYSGSAAGGVDVLQVEVLDAGGTVVARATANVTTLAAFILFSVAGTWAADTAPPPGTYRYTDIQGSRQPNLSLGVDVVFMAYDNYAIGNGEFNSGIYFNLVIPSGSTLHAGQTFTKFNAPAQPVITAGQFQLVWSSDLNHPENGWAFVPGAFGSLTVTAVNVLSSGATAISFSYSVSNGLGGTVSGSGVGGYR